MYRLAMVCLSAVYISGCASVHITVNSVANRSGLSKSTPIVFPKQSGGIETEKVRRECAAGAGLAKLNVVESCTAGPCYFAVAAGSTGATKSGLTTQYDAYTRQYSYSSKDETARQIKISVYLDTELKELAWETALDSTGASENVLSVTKEMCYGGFLHFPEEVTALKERVRAR